MERIEYPLSPKYCEGWGEKDALREIFANELDLHKTFEHSWEGGYCKISDKSSGIPKSAFVIGEGTKDKNKQDVIGQFGEGLKIAALVIVRSGKEIYGETVGYSFLFKLEQSNNFEIPVLVLYLEANSKSKGTYICVQCSEDIYKEVIDMFLQLKGINGNIQRILPQFPGKLFTCGQFVNNIDSMFGYNTTNKEIVNRDRTIIDSYKLDSTIALAIEKITNTAIISSLLKAIITDDKSLEYKKEMHLSLNPCYPSLWRAELAKLCDIKKLCVGDVLSSITTAKDMGYNVITLDYYQRELFKHLRIPTATDVINKDSKLKLRSVKKSLTIDERKRLKKVTTFVENVMGVKCHVPVIVVNSLKGQNNIQYGITVMGMVHKSKIYITSEVSKGSLEQLLEVLIHEYIHFAWGVYDVSRDFEKKLSEMCGKLAVMSFPKDE